MNYRLLAHSVQTMMHDNIIHESDATGLASRKSLWLPLICGVMLMVITFSPPHRDAPDSLGNIDPIALVKVGVRAAVIAVLLLTLLLDWLRPERRLVTRSMLPLGLFVVWAILSTLWSPIKSITLGQAGSLLALFLVAVVLAMRCRRLSDASIVVGVLSLTLLLLSSVLLLCYFIAPGINSMSRYGAGLFHAGNAAATASLCLVLTAIARLFWNWTWSRYLLLPVIVVCTAVLYYSHNRTSLFITVLILVLAGLFTLSRDLLGAMIVALCMVLTVYIVVEPGMEVAAEIVDASNTFMRRGATTSNLNTLSGRTELWTEIWTAYQKSPLIGYGYFMNTETGMTNVWGGAAVRPAHNVGLQLIASTGIAGAVLFLWGMLSLSRKVWRGRILSDGHYRAAIVLGLLIVWYLVWGMFSTSIFGPLQPECVVFFCGIGISVGLFTQPVESYA